MKSLVSATSLFFIALLGGCGDSGGSAAMPQLATPNPSAVLPNSVTISPGAVRQYSIPATLIGAMTLGPDGNLWYTGVENTLNQPSDEIGRVTPSGAVTVYHTPTANSEPTQIVAGPDGNLWAIEGNAAKLLRVTPSGIMTEFQMPYPAAVPPRPTSLAVGPDNNIWYWDSLSSEADKFDLATEKFTFGPAILIHSQNGDAQLRNGPGGRFWLDEADNYQTPGHIAVLDGTGALIAEFAVTPPPIDQFVIGPDNNPWYVDAGNPLPRIVRMTTSGSVTPFALPAGYRETPIFPTSAHDGNIYFALGAPILGRITTAGTITIFDLPATCPNADSLNLANGVGQTLWMFDGANFSMDLIDLTQLQATSSARIIRRTAAGRAR